MELARESAAAEDIASQVELRAVSARILVRRGEADEAECVAREAVALVERSEFLNMRAGTLLALAEVLWLTGRREEAARRAEEGLALFEANGNVAGLASARRAIVELTGEPLAQRD